MRTYPASTTNRLLLPRLRRRRRRRQSIRSYKVDRENLAKVLIPSRSAPL